MNRDFSVFLDRDGVICNNIDGGHRSVDTVKGIPGSDKALQMLAQLNCNIFIVTNQSWIHRCQEEGAWTKAWRINELIVDRIESLGGRITDFTMCYHTPQQNCSCRKPHPGMIWSLAHKGHLNKKSYMIGDARTDIYAGTVAGLTPYMVRTGRGQEQYKTGGTIKPYLKKILYDDLLDVVENKIWPKHAITPFVTAENVKPD